MWGGFMSTKYLFYWTRPTLGCHRNDLSESNHFARRRRPQQQKKVVDVYVAYSYVTGRLTLLCACNRRSSAIGAAKQSVEVSNFWHPVEYRNCSLPYSSANSFWLFDRPLSRSRHPAAAAMVAATSWWCWCPGGWRWTAAAKGAATENLKDLK